MNDTYSLIFLAFFTFVGALMGYSIGESKAREAIAACEKELPRNVNCTIIAVPVDKN